MKQFKVLTDGQYIYGVEVIYCGSNGEEISSGKNVARHGSENSWESFDFQDGEFITELSVRTGSWMDKIALSTNLGRRFSAGGNGGDHYDVVKASTSGKTINRVVAIGGAFGDQMKNLKAFYTKVPKSK